MSKIKTSNSQVTDTKIRARVSEIFCKIWINRRTNIVFINIMYLINWLKMRLYHAIPPLSIILQYFVCRCRCFSSIFHKKFDWLKDQSLKNKNRANAYFILVGDFQAQNRKYFITKLFLFSRLKLFQIKLWFANQPFSTHTMCRARIPLWQNKLNVFIGKLLLGSPFLLDRLVRRALFKLIEMHNQVHFPFLPSHTCLLKLCI